MSEREPSVPPPPPQPETGHWGRRVAVNALSPFLAQIFTKTLMLGYGIVQFRLIGGGTGRLGEYFLAGIVLMYTSTIADWGLSTLLTREVARLGTSNELEETDNSKVSRVGELFRATLRLRLAISIGLFAPVGLFVLGSMAWLGLSAEGGWVTLLLTLSLLPGAFSGSVTALMYARERMHEAAMVGVGTSLLNVALGVGALLAGWGVIGLAASALVTTIVTAVVFWSLSSKYELGIVNLESRDLIHNSKFIIQNSKLLRLGWPLMLNALLVGLFFRADQFIIKANLGDLGVERYQAAYSFLSFALLITPAVTLAMFPRMARHAETDLPRLAYEYRFTLKMLLIVSAPLVAMTIWFGPLLITIITGGKPEFVPSSVEALRILILFLPLSFINGVTQYVLIALNRQYLMTWAFGATVLFNLGANTALVPVLGINGAAIATIASEIVLAGPLLFWVSREIGRVAVGELVWRPALAGVGAMGIGWMIWPLQERWQAGLVEFGVYAAGGLLVLIGYLAALALLRPMSGEEIRGVRGALGRR